jgi:hypothetical protein
MNGLIRYNAIQKALSSLRKDSGVKFIASFQKTASQIYHSTKGEPLKHLLNNIDKAYKNVIPELPSEAFGLNNFWQYEDYATSFPADLHVRSKQLHGEKWDSADPDYQIVFKNFSDYCNANKNTFWHNSHNAPTFHFGAIDFDSADDCYYTEIILEDENAYGYVPGMDAEINDSVAQLEEREETTTEPEPEIEKPTKEKPTKDDKEIRKIQAETERTKAETEKIKSSKEKLSALNTAVKNLDSQLKRKLITKKQYSKFLNKLYDM